MTRNEWLSSMRNQFSKLMFGEPDTAQFTTTDNKNLIVLGTDIAVGVEIYELDSNNAQTPLSDGDYTLSDGRTITVKDNKVSEIIAPDPAQAEESPVAPASEDMVAPPVMEDTPTEDVPDESDDSESRISALESQVEELTNQIQELMQMLSGSMSKTEQVMNQHLEMSEKIKEISNEPGGIKTNPSKKMIENNSTVNTVSMDEIRSIQKRMNPIG